MNRKGQALVEFVLILPVFIMILFLVVDFGNIYSKKARLESVATDIIDAFKNGADYNEIKKRYDDYLINVDVYEDYKKISVIYNVDLITPFADLIIDDPYEILAERCLYD